MTNLTPSLFGEFSDKDVRWNGNPIRPEWVAKDVCEILGIQNHRDTIKDLPDNYKGVVITDTPGGKQELLSVTEPGLYRLIFASRKPEAEKFRAWVFEVVLPTIRKYGRYSPVYSYNFETADLRLKKKYHKLQGLELDAEILREEIETEISRQQLELLM